MLQTENYKDIVFIKEPFYAAGKIYGWTHKYKSIGLGINLVKLEGDGLLWVRVGESDKLYSIEKDLARKFIETYSSYHDAKSVKLGVIAWDAFVSKEEINDQQKLF